MADVHTPDVIPATNASNTTRYFHLPLFISTDKPSWLVDWNGAMGEIDTILQNINTASEGAVADVQTIQTQIDAINQLIPTLEATIQTAVEDVASMETTVSSHESRLDTVEQDLLTQNNLIKTLSDAVLTIQATLTSLTDRVTALEQSGVTGGVTIYDLLDNTKYNAINFLTTMAPSNVYTVQNDGYLAGYADATLGSGTTDPKRVSITILDGLSSSPIEFVSGGMVQSTSDHCPVGCTPTFVKAGDKISIESFGDIEFYATPRTLKFYEAIPVNNP